MSQTKALSECSGLLVADVYKAPNGSTDAIPLPTKVGGQQVSVVLELQSTTRGFLVPRMTTAQRDAMVVTDGFVIYNLDTASFNLRAGGAWGSVSAGSVTGPGVSVAGDIAIFADNSGSVIADSGVSIVAVPAPGPFGAPLVTVNQIGNLGHVKFVNGVGLIFVDTLMPVEFIENNFGPGSQVCSLFTGELPGSSTTPSCLVELQSSTGALVISRMTTAQRVALFATNGMIVYDTNIGAFYGYQGGIWAPIDTSGGSVTQINAGTGITCAPNPIVAAGTISLTNTAVTPANYTVGNFTVNAQGQLTAASSASKIQDNSNGLGGGSVLVGLTVGAILSVSNSVAMGDLAFANSPLCTGCVAIGSKSLSAGNTGNYCTAVGMQSLLSNTSGSSNTAFGAFSLANLTSAGGGNSAFGTSAGAGAATYTSCSFFGASATGITGITNSTAIGANASVAISNALVLGNGSASVGINDSSPGSLLSVVGNAQIGFTSGVVAPTNGLLVNGNVGIGLTATHAPLQFAAATVNRKIVLYETFNNDHQFYGFGVNAGVTRYQVDASGSDHVFYSGSSSIGSLELFRIKGGGNSVAAGYFTVGGLTANASYTAKLQIPTGISTRPVNSALSALTLGTAFQNTLGYDVILIVYINITVNAAGGTISSGVGSTNTPTQQNITIPTGLLSIIPVTVYLPNQYFALISVTTITGSIAGQQATAV